MVAGLSLAPLGAGRTSHRSDGRQLLSSKSILNLRLTLPRLYFLPKCQKVFELNPVCLRCHNLSCKNVPDEPDTQLDIGWSYVSIHHDCKILAMLYKHLNSCLIHHKRPWLNNGDPQEKKPSIFRNNVLYVYYYILSFLSYILCIVLIFISIFEMKNYASFANLR